MVKEEIEKLYLRPINFNICRIVTKLAEFVKSSGGRVKPSKKKLICDRTLFEKQRGFIEVEHTNYITFELSGYVYYLQFDDNPFFPTLYCKTPLRGSKYSKDACLDELSDDWFSDVFYQSNVPSTAITGATTIILAELLAADESHICKETGKIAVPNIYDNGWHWETKPAPERLEVLNW